MTAFTYEGKTTNCNCRKTFVILIPEPNETPIAAGKQSAGYKKIGFSYRNERGCQL